MDRAEHVSLISRVECLRQSSLAIVTDSSVRIGYSYCDIFLRLYADDLSPV